MLKASTGMKERGEDESFALAESGKHDHYLRGATSEAVFITILFVPFLLGFGELNCILK